jgi:predicted ester cyclase
MDHSDLVEAMLAAENAHDWSAMGALWTEDATFHHPGLGPLTGRDANMAFISYFAGAIEGYRREIFDHVSNGDRGAFRWQITGRHTGEIGPYPPTGEPVDISGALFYETRDGRLCSGREVIEHESIRGFSLR